MNSKSTPVSDADDHIIFFKTTLRNTILDVMLGRGWEELGEEFVHIYNSLFL